MIGTIEKKWMLSNSIERMMPRVVRMATMEQPSRPASATRLDRVAGAELGADLEESEGKADEREAESRSVSRSWLEFLTRHLVAGSVDGEGLGRDGQRDALAHQQRLTSDAGIGGLLELFGGELSRGRSRPC